MNRSSQRQVVVLQLRSVPLRILWLLGCGFILAWGLTGVYHDFRGRARAAVDPDVEGLQEAAHLLPQDPELQHQLGLLYLLDPLRLDADRALIHFQRAVKRSPYDFSLWIDLGRAYEQRGQWQRAVESYQQAIALAPTYFHPRWIYANFLLRSHRTDEGLNEFVHLVEADREAAFHIFDLAWQASGGNGPVLVAFGGQLRSDGTRADLVKFLAQRGRASEALAVWDRVALDPRLKVESGLELIPKLVGAQQWEQAQRVWQQTLAARFGNISSDEVEFWNAGFERDPLNGGFDWSLESTPAVEVAIDRTVSQAGAHSLRLRFRQHEDVRFAGVSHQMLVRPSTDYVLRFQYKTEGMLSHNGLAIEVKDGERPDRLRVQSEPLRNPTEWTTKTLPFHTSADTRAISIRILRQPTDTLHDYIAGQVWFDAFALEP